MRWSWLSFAEGAATATVVAALIATCSDRSSEPSTGTPRVETRLSRGGDPHTEGGSGKSPAEASYEDAPHQRPRPRSQTRGSTPIAVDPHSSESPSPDFGIDPPLRPTTPAVAALPGAAKPKWRHGGPTSNGAGRGQTPDRWWSATRAQNAADGTRELEWTAGSHSASRWIPDPAELLAKARAAASSGAATDDLAVALTAVARAADVSPPNVAALVQTLDSSTDANVRLAALQGLLSVAGTDLTAGDAVIRASRETVDLGVRLYALDHFRDVGPRGFDDAVSRLLARDYATEDLPGLAAAAVRSDRIAEWISRLEDIEALRVCAFALRGTSEWTRPPLSELRAQVPSLARRLCTTEGHPEHFHAAADLIVTACPTAAVVDFVCDTALPPEARWQVLYAMGYWTSDPAVLTEAAVRILGDPTVPEDVGRLAIGYLRDDDLRLPRVDGCLRGLAQRHPSPYFRQDVRELLRNLDGR